MKKLSPQKQYIYSLYKSGNWICSTKIEFVRDHRKRISEMREMGFNFESKKCDGICGVNHTSNIHTYRLIDTPKREVYVYELINGIRVPKLTLQPYE